MLATFIPHEDHSIRLAAVVASGHARDRSLAGAVAVSLDASSDEERMQAAITLGHLGAPEFAPAMAARLSKEKGRVLQALVAALEMMRARTVLPVVVSALRTAASDQVWELAHALAVISGADVAVEPKAAPEGLRKAWLDAAAKDMLATVPPARVANVRSDAKGLVTFDVLFGRGSVRIDFDPPVAGATWPRWGRSLLVRGQRVVDLGSTCSTCESLVPGRAGRLRSDAGLLVCQAA